MHVLLRFDVALADGAEFRADAEQALAALGACPGFRNGWIGRALDDPGAWMLACEWAGVGAYRRALSSYDVKLRATALLARARDEPSAYEPLIRLLDGTLSIAASDRA